MPSLVPQNAGCRFTSQPIAEGSERTLGRSTARSVVRSGIAACSRRRTLARDMSDAVDFVNVSTVGLESSPVAAALAGLRAHEARYFHNKYDYIFRVEPAAKAKETINWVHRILKEDRDIV